MMLNKYLVSKILQNRPLVRLLALMLIFCTASCGFLPQTTVWSEVDGVEFFKTQRKTISMECAGGHSVICLPYIGEKVTSRLRFPDGQEIDFSCKTPASAKLAVDPEAKRVILHCSDDQTTLFVRSQTQWYFLPPAKHAIAWPPNWSESPRWESAQVDLICDWIAEKERRQILGDALAGRDDDGKMQLLSQTATCRDQFGSNTRFESGAWQKAFSELPDAAQKQLMTRLIEKLNTEQHGIAPLVMRILQNSESHSILSADQATTLISQILANQEPDSASPALAALVNITAQSNAKTAGHLACGLVNAPGFSESRHAEFYNSLIRAIIAGGEGCPAVLVPLQKSCHGTKQECSEHSLVQQACTAKIIFPYHKVAAEPQSYWLDYQQTPTRQDWLAAAKALCQK